MRVTTPIVLLLLLATSGDASTSIESNALSGAPSSAPTFRRKKLFYVLAGKSLVEIEAEHHAMAAKGEAPTHIGLTNWDATFKTTRDFGTKTSCAAEPVFLYVTLTTVLPKAVNSHQFSSDDHTQWNSFLPALTRHEARHDSVIVSEASAFFREVEGEGAATIIKSLNQCVEELRVRIDRANASLDEVTQNGKTDGAMLILPPIRK